MKMVKRNKLYNECKNTIKIADKFLGVIGISMISSWIILLIILFFPFLG